MWRGNGNKKMGRDKEKGIRRERERDRSLDFGTRIPLLQWTICTLQWTQLDVIKME